MFEKRVLVDCDGVLSQFLTSALEVINKHFESNFQHQHVTDFDICGSLGIPHAWEILKNSCSNPDFVATMQKIPGADEGLKRLREISDVYVVTSPMNVPNWAYERQRWLTSMFDFTPDKIVQTEAKHVIVGDVIIDDKFENVLSWTRYHPNGLGILFHAPYNEKNDIQGYNIVRAETWNCVIDIIERHFKIK